MTLLVQRTVEERESSCDAAVERIGTAPGICIDCLAPGPAEAESGRLAPVAPSAGTLWRSFPRRTASMQAPCR